MQKYSVIFFFREEKQHIKLPRDIDDAKRLGRVLSRYKDKYYVQVLGGYFITYILYPFIGLHFLFNNKLFTVNNKFAEKKLHAINIKYRQYIL